MANRRELAVTALDRNHDVTHALRPRARDDLQFDFGYAVLNIAEPARDTSANALVD